MSLGFASKQLADLRRDARLWSNAQAIKKVSLRLSSPQPKET
jgi:hypothetical protein